MKIKNPLAVVTKNELVKNAGKEISKFVIAHEGLLFTGGTIAFNAAGIAATYKNAPKIQQIISDTKTALAEAEDEEVKRKLAVDSFKQLLPLVSPIAIFFVASATCAIVGHKKSQAKIATLTAALTLAQSTINDYDLFKKEVEKEVGEEKFKEINDTVVKDSIEQKITNHELPAAFMNPRRGEYPVCIPLFGIYFTSTAARIDMAFEHINQCLDDNGSTGKYSYGNENEIGGEIVYVSDLCDELGVFEDDRPDIVKYMGWDAQKTPRVHHENRGGITASGIPYIYIYIPDYSWPYMIDSSGYDW